MMRGIADHTSVIMLALGLALMALILLRRSGRYFRRTKRRNVPAIEEVARPSPSLDESPNDCPSDVLRWQVEMHETARRLAAELDTKTSVLRQLLLMATQATEKLDQSIRRAEQLGLPRGRDTLSEIQQATAEPSGADGHGRLGPLPSRLPPTSAASQGRLEDSQDHQQAVYRLADLGHSPTSIAEQLGISIGEIEMLLSLRASE